MFALGDINDVKETKQVKAASSCIIFVFNPVEFQSGFNRSATDLKQRAHLAAFIGYKFMVVL
jgi:hypothetical protein